MEVIGYKYNTEEEAKEVRKQCADHYGLPIAPDDITIYWVDYDEAELNSPVFWFIYYDDSLRDILGTPETFDVIIDMTKSESSEDE